MISIHFLSFAIVWCIFLVAGKLFTDFRGILNLIFHQNIMSLLSGVDAKRMSGLVAYIDYEKHLKSEEDRFGRQTSAMADYDSPLSDFSSSNLGSEPLLPSVVVRNRKNLPVCADPINEVYQKCGNKCVLGCRYAGTMSDTTISKNDCGKSDCMAGCFCKAGLVRHQSKCIPVAECPVRKCQRDEVYVST